MNSFLTMLQRKPNVSIIVEWKVREENIYLYNAGTRSMVASLGTRSLVQDLWYKILGMHVFFYVNYIMYRACITNANREMVTDRVGQRLAKVNTKRG